MPMSNSDYTLDQILQEMRKQTKLLQELVKKTDDVERAVWDTAPQ